jgi:hypothetical protein
VQFAPETDGVVVRYLEWEGRCAAVRTTVRSVASTGTAEELGRHLAVNDPDRPGDTGPAALIGACGNGTVALAPLDMGDQYLRSHHPLIADFLTAVIARLVPRPLVTVRRPADYALAATDSRPRVDVTAMRKDGSLRVNLVNTGGPHANREIHVYDSVPPTGPLEIVVRTAKPGNVTLEPGRREVKWEYSDGTVRALVPTVAIHDVLVIQQA